MESISTRAITFLGMGLAFAVFLGASWAIEQSLGLNTPIEMVILLITLVCLIAAFPGVIFIRRKESPSKSLTKYIHGSAAILSGIGWIFFWLSPALMAITYYIGRLSH